MTPELTEFILKFNEKLREAQVFLCIARDSELQRQVCLALESQAIDLRNRKLIAIANKDEVSANILLGCECLNTSILAELKMWLLLKEEKPSEAWNCLITAQDSALAAIRSSEGFSKIENHLSRLEALEKIVFPPQIFFSSGFIIGNLECSVCHSEYGECDHLIGKPYLGQFCHVIARNITVDHVAIVQEPADKRCRALSFSVDGGNRDRMTWVVTKSLPAAV
jgi:hypothetical protein